MSARIGVTGIWSSLAVRKWLPTTFGVALLLWMASVAGQGALLVGRSFGIPLLGAAKQSFASPPLLATAGLLMLVCGVAALIARRVRPAATLPVTCGVGGLVLLGAAVSSGSLGPLLLVLIFFGVALFLGYGLLDRLSSPLAHPGVSLPVALALGLGISGWLLLLLASLTWLNAATVLGLAGALLALVLFFDRRRLVADVAQVRAWHPETPTWFETIVIGVAVGTLTIAMLADFMPEIDGDATRDHLPVAREIWQSGAVGKIPTFSVSQDPVQGHLLYAVAYGLAGEGYSGITAAKLVHAGVGLVAIVGIAGLGWIVSGRFAAVIGAALFATTPLVMWALGHAPLDLFPVLFTVAALLCLIHWQRVGAPAWLVVAGALAGFGFAAKITMAWLAVALAAAIFLVGRKRWQLSERVLAVLAFGVGTIVLVPWLVRSYSITGILPGLNIVVDLVTSALSQLGVRGALEIGTSTDVSAPVANGPIPAEANPVSDGPGHSVIALAQSPWLLTFDINRFRYATSPIGIAPLLLLPLAVLGPRTRATALLAVTAVVSYVGWWVTPQQVVRHLLPTLAIVAVLVGAGVASVVTGAGCGLTRLLVVATRAGVLVGLVAGPLLFLPEKNVGISIDRLTGRETAAEYVARQIPGAAMLAAMSDTLPPDTLVGSVRDKEYAQLYTEARLIQLQDDIDSLPSSETFPATVLATLDRLGIDYVLWDRTGTAPKVWRSALLSTQFLREHSRILAGTDNAYLFEILPNDGLTWGAKHLRNLLADPGFDTIKKHDSPWTIGGKVKTRDGRVSMKDASAIAQEVPVSAGVPYLLSATATCPESKGWAELRLRWMDSDGVTISTAAESVIPGTEGSEQFLWRHAPEQATAVSAELASNDCEFDAATLYALS